MSLFSELKRRNVLRVAAAYLAGAWLLVEVSDTLFSIYGLPETAARIVATLVAIGFPITLVLSWVYELTSEGLKLEKDIDRTEPGLRTDTRLLDRAIIVLLALALGYFAIDKFVLEPGRVAEIVEETAQQVRSEALVESYGGKSIAVLPFVNMSADPEQEYFSDGISEELLNLLAQIPELRVISRSSAFSFKGKDIAIPDVATQLNVAHVLEGSVRKSGKRVRITAQLIEARSDTHLWSQTYDRALDDIFAIQDEIAASVVNQLKVTLLDNPVQAEVVHPEAYTLYLQAAYIGAQMSPSALEQSNTLLKQALAIHPDFARAWRLMARNLAVQIDHHTLPKNEGEDLIRHAINQALTIDPNLAIAHSWLAARTAGDSGGDLMFAAERMRHALSLEPNNHVVLSHAAGFLQVLGRLNDAIEIREYVLKRDPLGPITYNNLGWNYLSAGRSQDALSAARTLRMLSPHYGGLDGLEGLALLHTGDYQTALQTILAEPVEYWRLNCLVQAYQVMGLPEESDAMLAELIDQYGEDRPYWIAALHAYRNEADQAFEWLEKAVDTEDSALQYLLTEPSFDNLSEDPRWMPFLQRLGKSPEQLSAIQFEVKLPRQAKIQPL